MICDSGFWDTWFRNCSYYRIFIIYKTLKMRIIASSLSLTLTYNNCWRWKKRMWLYKMLNYLRWEDIWIYIIFTLKTRYLGSAIIIYSNIIRMVRYGRSVRFEDFPLICLRRLSRAKKWIIEFKFNEKKKWLDLKFKNLLCSLLFYYILDSTFNKIIIIALNNRMLNDSEFDAIVI